MCLTLPGGPILCGLAVKRTIKIHIGGQQYILRSDADESYVQALADSVNSRLDAFKGSRQVATQSDVVLAALKLADELEHEKQSQSRLRAEVRGQVELMLGQVEAQIGAPASEVVPPVSPREPRSRRSAQAVSHKAR
jgi:cell division protein ZapA (FtsZ GTPase activity inhibitor)